ncbi:Uncharacterised protein [Legionella israelensis]|uniref:Uncharacterized protein n=2 Tax=Legionella israelensis TaxID=454 RepID=A0A0W0V1N9_9GAMM|nr:hypothetical protein [Legionella israelensis]KTD14043.1 hypothetical protein Lisr_2819 [Legionella israelensis]SCY04494.1 hypothetical protein SAMN02746069_01097 [Legionella israelensis DSM 19235]STX60634.1 Uncharacterised protein [Legionella israelensis]
MKLERMIELIEKNGFEEVIKSKKGMGIFEGREVLHFQKNSSRYLSPEVIQLGVSPADKEDVLPVFTKNVSQKLRDDIYNLMKNPSAELEHSALNPACL